MADKAVHANNVTKRFGALTALDNVSLEIAKGEVFGMVGPSGAVKTTLVNLITSMLADTPDIDVADQMAGGFAEADGINCTSASRHSPRKSRPQGRLYEAVG